MIKAAFFDLDGTTVNSLESIAHFANKTLVKFGYSAFPTDKYRYLAGGGAKKLWHNIIEASGAPEELFLPMMNDWLDTYDNDFLYLTKPYDGIKEMLAAMKNAGLITAVITNKHGPTGRKICSVLFGDDGSLLNECVADYPGMTLKPSPDELFKLMNKYGINSTECIYCGDHSIDMVTAKNAGVCAVGVTWGFHTRAELIENGADFIADTPSDILKIALGKEYAAHE